MSKRRLAYIMILTFTLAVSFIAGYFTSIKYYNKNNSSSNLQEIEDKYTTQTIKTPASEIINESTVIVKRDRYTKGTTFVNEYTEKPASDIIGMDIYAAENYFKGLGYIIIKFSPQSEKKVIVSKEISDIWPSDCYVVKENNGFVALYKAEKDNSLSLVRITEIKIENLPLQEREDLIKGKVFKTREEAENLIEEDYNS